MSFDKYFVIIPAYEPDEKMLGVIDDVRSQTDFSIIVVNDGSGKDKAPLFEQAEKSAVVLNHEINRGKGAGIKTALKYINENITGKAGIIIADADGQHKIGDIKRIAAALDENPSKLIMGCRKFTGNIPARSKFGNNVTKLVFSFAAGVRVSDTQTGLRGFSSGYIPFMLELSGERYEFEMNMLLECARENIGFFEVPIETVYIGKNESSHFNPIKDSIRIYKDIIKFSCSSLLSFIVDYLLYTVFNLITGSLTFSNIGARVLSSCFNFGMNKKFVFKNKDGLGRTAAKYFLLAAFILAANTVLLYLCTEYLISNKYIAKILIEVLLFFISWAVQKSFVFRKKERNDQIQ
ncbi:MAG: bifunctional glycosyltransferase family 2/GtrA family protein [Ruminococcus sp.]|nr:bifunctional glycosyltransferase family 2/GtrA family protein [Ruminococcus sp.]